MIDFILQNTEDGRRGPFAALRASISLRSIRKSVVALIGKRGEDAEPVQLFRDFGGASTVQPHTEDILHHAGGVGVGDKLVFVFLGALL